MLSGSKIQIKFDRELYPFWKMLNSVFCEITEPSNFIGDCQQVENTFEVTVAQEYDFNTEYIIQTSGISQAPKES